MKSPLDWSVTPLRRFADFQGRSTRTELAFFYLLTAFLNLAIGWPALAVSLKASQAAQLVFTLLLLCPWIALGVRRLHDTGRGGWWLLPALPGLGFGLWDRYRFIQQPLTPFESDPNETIAQMALGLGALLVLVLLLLPDEEGENRYGANPRYGSEQALG